MQIRTNPKYPFWPFLPLGAFPKNDPNNNKNFATVRKNPPILPPILAANLPPRIEVTSYCDDFEMPPLETMSPFDFMQDINEDRSAFFMGSIDNFKQAWQPAETMSVGGESTGWVIKFRIFFFYIFFILFDP